MPHIEENKRDEAILKWVRENRPDLVNLIEEVFSPGLREIIPRLDNLYLILSVGFEAGRQFQFDNLEKVESRGFSVDSSR